MNNDKIFFCTLCQKTWTTATLPENAVQLTTGHGGGPGVYRFASGEIHTLIKKTVPSIVEERSS